MREGDGGAVHGAAREGEDLRRVHRGEGGVGTVVGGWAAEMEGLMVLRTFYRRLHKELEPRCRSTQLTGGEERRHGSDGDRRSVEGLNGTVERRSGTERGNKWLRVLMKRTSSCRGGET